MKMEWDFEKSGKCFNFIGNKAQIDPDFHFRLFETVPRDNDGLEAPGSMEILHLEAGGPAQPWPGRPQFFLPR